MKQLGSSQSLFIPSPGSLLGQTILITGASTGLGLEAAKRLAAGGANVVMTTRSDSNGEAAVQKVLSYVSRNDLEVNGGQKIVHKVLDLDNLNSVREAVQSWSDIETIDVLLNNAGVMALPDYQLTVDGFERQIQSNHLGHFLLTALLATKLSPGARIINVSSEAHKVTI
jgi:NAD(P)-dependent dehydrogenase (short-subunit alcohol dehydrogenase family)